MLHQPRHFLPLLLALLLWLPAGQAAAERELLDRIVAVVNNGVILQSELDAEIKLVRAELQRQGQQLPPENVLRERVLENLIVEQIQLQQARLARISVDDETVNRALSQMAQEHGTNLSGLREHFTERGVDFSRVRSDVRNQLTISQLQQRAVAGSVTVSEQEVEDFLDRLDREEDRETEYRVEHILIAVSSNASSSEIDDAEQRAGEIVAGLRQGEDFAEVAARESDGPRALEGGDLGWRGPADMPALFSEAVRRMNAGDISEPLRSANGFHILRLADRRGGSQEQITEVRARHILVRERNEQGDASVPDIESAARVRAAELRDRIMAGASFEELAAAHSDDSSSGRRGGDLGWFGPGDMHPAFQEVVDDLPAGRISEPFRTPFGWHIVEVLDRRDRTDTDRHRRAQVQQTLYRQRVEEETQRWVRELYDEAFIEIRLDS